MSTPTTYHCSECGAEAEQGTDEQGGEGALHCPAHPAAVIESVLSALHHGSHEFYGDISPCGACGYDPVSLDDVEAAADDSARRGQ